MASDADTHPIPLERAELTSRLRWFIQLRWVFGSAVLAAGIALTYIPLVEVRGPLIAAIGGGILVYNCVFWLLERRLDRSELSVLARRGAAAGGRATV